MGSKARALVAWAAVAAMGLSMASAAMAWANPAPGRGPIAGGTTVKLSLPQTSFTDISQAIAPGTNSHGLATTVQGQAYAWGLNQSGQLGDGTTQSSSAPIAVKQPEGVRFQQVEASDGTSLALTSEGQIYAWGSDAYRASGSVAPSRPDTQLTPAKVQGLPNDLKFTDIAVGSNHYVALGEDGSLWGWGSNISGQLGIGSALPSDYNAPTRTIVPEGVTFTELVAGPHLTLAIDSHGNVWGTGQSRLGDPGAFTWELTKLALPDVPGGYKAAAVGAWYSMVLAADGTLYSWGENNNGQLGNGTAVASWEPAQVHSGGVKFTSITAGAWSSFAIASDGAPYAWGFGSPYGNLGVGEFANQTTPSPITLPDNVSFATMAAGYSTSQAIGSDGYLYSWGAGDSLGLGADTQSSALPTKMGDPSLKLTAVTFGASKANSATFQEVSRGVWTIQTPAHEAGPVDVTVSWNLSGDDQSDIFYERGFTYTQAPSITRPSDVTAQPGGQAVFTVTTQGFPTPIVSWFLSRDDGQSWSNVIGVKDMAVSRDGRTLTVSATEGADGLWVRATASNPVGEASSETAHLSVTGAGVSTAGPNPPSNPSPSVSATSRPGPPATGARA